MPWRESSLGTMSEPLRAAVLGYGLSGSVFHAPVIMAVPELSIAAVVTHDPARIAAARAALPGVRVVPTAEELWQLADRLDLAVVATPNRTHVPLATAALNAGLHVVVDKPLATTAAEGQRLIDHARASRRLLTVFHNRRFDGDFRTVRRLIADGELGRVHRFESRFEHWRPIPKAGWRASGTPADGGGLLNDLGSHLVDQALCLFGPVVTVYAELDRCRPDVEVDDDVFVALHHASGVTSHLWASALAGQRGPRFRVLGDRATFVKYGLDVQEEALRAGRRPGGRSWGRDPPEAYGVLGVDGACLAVATEPGGYQDFYAGLAAALRNGAPSPVEAAEAVATLAVLDACRRSAAHGVVTAL
jgi:scyllo-inositol 2-dehydrogenase (NADP+)